MRMPIKFNRAGWPRLLWALPLMSDDPRSLAFGRCGAVRESFSRSLSVLKFGTTFKTTLAGRQPHSTRFLAGRYAGEAPVVLDIGASDGSTSLDLLGALAGQFGHYFVTDFNISVRLGVDTRGRHYFADASGTCILRASPRWLAYADVGDAPLPLRLLAKRLLSGSRDVSSWEEILLVHPELVALAQAEPRITIARYDVFSPWAGMRPDLIKIANVLNRCYFSEGKIAEALRVQCSALAIGGRLILVENRAEREQFSAFIRTTTSMQLEHSYDGGSDVAVLVPTSF
jgi:hypothetical protein